MNATIDRARALGAPAVAVTFHPAPRDVLSPDNPIPRIQSLEDRLTCLYDLGLDHVVVQAFTLLIALGYVFVNLIVDVSYAFVDPRVRLK